MSRKPLHALTWSSAHAQYDFSVSGKLTQSFALTDETGWLACLATVRSFAFYGQVGSLNVYSETRPRGGAYWYAYHTTGRRTRKRYLGQSMNVTLVQLEEVAHALQAELASSSESPDVARTSQVTAWEKTSAPDMSPATTGWLTTRLSHPLTPPTLVMRERLLTRLDAAFSHRLTVLSASAGWGKTTLLSAWAARSSAMLAWLSLDALDNEPTRFWLLMLAALRTCYPSIGETPLAMLRSPLSQPLTTSLLVLLQELAELPQPLALIIDDYHLIEDQAIHDSLLFYLEHLPTHVHLIVAGRVDPPLALARWRVRGQLLELRDTDLRFQEEEARCFFVKSMGLPLAPEEVTLLAQRTEGWAAGLQLAALSMHEREDLTSFVQDFAGSHRHVLDYVQEEILARLPAELQNFLPQIAILNRISAPLCQAITGEAESWLWLAQAERANLFLAPLDAERRWYRMNDLFREALLAHLRATQPESVPLLHQRAARFYEEQEAFREAIFHALAAEDFALAARLMEQTLEEVWLAGESQIFFQWVMALPSPIIRQHASFALTATLYLLNLASSTGEPRQAQLQMQGEQMLGRIDKALRRYQVASETLQGHDEQALFQQRLRLLRYWNEVITGNGTSSYERYRHAVQQIQQLQLEDTIIWRVLSLTITFVWHWTFQGKGTSLIPLFQDAWEQARQSRNHFALLKVQQWLAGVYVTAGKLHQAYHLCQSGLTLVAQIRGYTLLGGYFSNWLARVLYEWNRLDEARIVVQKLIAEAQRWQHFDLQVQGYIRWLEIEFAAGDLASAQQGIQQLVALFPDTGLDQYLLPLIQASCWLETGEIELAAQWAAQAATQQEPIIFVSILRYRLLLRAHIALACQDYSATLAILEAHREQLDLSEDLTARATFLALSVVALHHLGERARVQETLIQLLALTESEGYLRIYLNEGTPMQLALQDFLHASVAAEDETPANLRIYSLRILAAFAHAEQKRSLKPDALPDRAQIAELLPTEMSASPALLEPLTVQEQRVLHLLAAGLSTQEIAQMLIISRNTVKTHLRNLYGKLQANSRFQAIARARDLKLL